jgi:predicted nucleotidyltransferase
MNHRRQNEIMDRAQVIAVLRRCEPEFKAAGVESISLFGSIASDETAPSDLDVAVRLTNDFSAGGFDYFYQLDELEHHLSRLLGCKVDIIAEPVRNQLFQNQIDRDRALAF